MKLHGALSIWGSRSLGAYRKGRAIVVNALARSLSLSERRCLGGATAVEAFSVQGNQLVLAAIPSNARVFDVELRLKAFFSPTHFFPP